MEKVTGNHSGYQTVFEVVKNRHDQIRQLVEHQMRGAALALVKGLFDEEVERLSGPRFSRKLDERCHRGGTEDGRVILKGQGVRVTRPRLRNGGRELQLESYHALQGYDLLCERVMKHMLTGVSTRNYEGLLDELEGGLGLARSTVSKAFVRGSKQALDEINGRDLSAYRWLAVIIDGIEFDDRTVVVGLGITTAGKKLILGLREGSTEHWEVCKDLLGTLVERGLKTDEPFLFILDGGKALRKAVRKVFGPMFPVQRCVRHKERNVLQYLPAQYHAEFRRRWTRLHGMSSYQEALAEYDRLRDWLGGINQAALMSLEESEMETLTVIKLKVPGLLRKTLLSTNPLESVFAKVRHKSARVTHWRRGVDQVSRWAGAILLEAEKKFRTIRGYREIPIFLTELKKLSLQEKEDVA